MCRTSGAETLIETVGSLGEMSIHLTAGRTARLTAEENHCVFTLDAVAIVSLEVAGPKWSAAELHRRPAAVLATRLDTSNETLRALLR